MGVRSGRVALLLCLLRVLCLLCLLCQLVVRASGRLRAWSGGGEEN